MALAVGEALDVALPPLALLSGWGPPLHVEIPASEASPWLLGAAYEALLEPDGRRRAGGFFTPPALTAPIVAWALDGLDADRPTVCDPTAGGGAFLLDAAEALAARGVPRAEVVGELLTGVDVDPVAVAVSEAALVLWCGGQAVPRMAVGDALTLDADQWPAWPVSPHAVVGNPPFLGQLSRATARDRTTAAELRRRFGMVANGYVDTAALFLVLASRLVRPGGTVALVLPVSFLAVRDAAPARAAVLAGAALDVLWLPGQPVFGAASVRVCAVVLRRGAPLQGVVRSYRGLPPRPAGTTTADVSALARAPTWSHLVADATGIPDCELDSDGVLGEWCEVAADFRQQYYGLVPFLVDDPDDALDEVRFPRLVTCGLIDPARCWWGERPTRHHRRPWLAPRVDLVRLEAGSDLRSWARARLVPKVVVATQTRVVEAAVDRIGTWLPSTPLISVVPPPARLWHVAAVLLAPPVTAWALRSWGGTALSDGALKLGATQVRAVPTPANHRLWDEAAVAVRASSEAADDDERRRLLLAAAAISSRAYGVEDPAMGEWWAGRLPGPSGARPQAPARRATTGAKDARAGSGTVT